ncbi:MAG: HesA/MoeB/ThiF family protein [Chloroflexi bacterium]|nr:HesA/MoeB/ThiF family protein [Chloroflexota bacterium]
MAAATVTVVGCGGLGTVAAEILAQAGVGHLYLLDDQVFCEKGDAKAKQPQALIVAERLRVVNPALRVEPVVTRLTSTSVEKFLMNAHLVLDGTDNDATRHMINRVCVKQGIPWVFATVAESHGLTMNIVPRETFCFACVFGNPSRQSVEPGLGNEQEKGLLPTITHIMASLQVGQAIKLLLGNDDYSRDLLYVDAWNPLLKKVALKEQRGDCGICNR